MYDSMKQKYHGGYAFKERILKAKTLQDVHNLFEEACQTFPMQQRNVSNNRSWRRIVNAFKLRIDNGK